METQLGMGGLRSKYEKFSSSKLSDFGSASFTPLCTHQVDGKTVGNKPTGSRWWEGFYNQAHHLYFGISKMHVSAYLKESLGKYTFYAGNNRRHRVFPFVIAVYCGFITDD